MRGIGTCGPAVLLLFDGVLGVVAVMLCRLGDLFESRGRISVLTHWTLICLRGFWAGLVVLCP